MLSINKFQETLKNKKENKRRGFSLPEILVACAIIVALSVAAFFGYNQAQQTRKMAQMNNDMEALANGCLAYEALNLTSTPPDSLADLLTGLSADESVDGCAHDRFVTSTKTDDGTYLDPWGVEYGYDAEARTITCTPNDSSGAAMDMVTRYF